MVMSEAFSLDFPCELPIKVLGRNDDRFRTAAWAIVRNHYGELDAGRVSEQPSSKSSYLSVTFVVPAQSRDEVDALYRDLTASDDIMLVL